MEVDIKILQPDNLEDFHQLLTVFDVVFEYEPYTRPNDEHYKNLLSNPAFCAIVAKRNSKVIGGLTAYFLDQYHSVKPVLYIQDLGVMTEHQRKGVGRKLIAYTKAYCSEKNLQLMYVQAEKEDAYAVEFYRSTNPTEELDAVHFSYTTSERDTKA